MGVGPTLGLGLALGLTEAPRLGLALAAGLFAGLTLGLGEAEPLALELGLGLGDETVGSAAAYVSASQSRIPVISMASRPVVQTATSCVRAVCVA